MPRRGAAGDVRAIVVYAAVRLIDLPGFRRLAAFRRAEFGLALAARAGVLVFDILYGILVAVGLSVAETLHRVARPHDAVQGFVPALAAAADEGVAWFVLNTEANVEVDSTALDAMEQLRAELTGRGVVFALARVKQDLRDDLDKFGLTAAVGEDRIFPTLPTAVDAYKTWRQAHPA